MHFLTRKYHCERNSKDIFKKILWMFSEERNNFYSIVPKFLSEFPYTMSHSTTAKAMLPTWQFIEIPKVTKDQQWTKEWRYAANILSPAHFKEIIIRKKEFCHHCLLIAMKPVFCYIPNKLFRRLASGRNPFFSRICFPWVLCYGIYIFFTGRMVHSESFYEFEKGNRRGNGV